MQFGLVAQSEGAASLSGAVCAFAGPAVAPTPSAATRAARLHRAVMARDASEEGMNGHPPRWAIRHLSVCVAPIIRARRRGLAPELPVARGAQVERAGE